MAEKLKKIDRFIGKGVWVINHLCGILIFLLTVTVFSEVMSRYIFNYPISITTELTSILFPWATFLSVIVITINDENISLVFIRDKFTGRKRKIYNVFISMLTLFFSVTMLVSGFILNKTLYRQTLPILGISKFFLYGSVLVCFIGITLVLMLKTFKNIVELMNYKENSISKREINIKGDKI